MRLIIIVALVTGALGDVHRLYVGNVNPPAAIYALAFEDVTSEVFVMNNITAASTHDWITLNHDKTHLYAASLNSTSITSYTVSTDNLRLDRTIALNGVCAGKHTAFVAASGRAPYTVYTGSYPGPSACGASLSSDSTGALAAVRQTWNYGAASGISGLALGARRGRCDNSTTELVYSADLPGDAIWTHEVSVAGVVTERGRLATAAGSHPRHLVVHPNGKRLYVLLEAGNEVTTYLLDASSGLPTTLEGSVSLLSSATDSTQYISTDLALSHNASYLWATAQAKVAALDHGYVSGFQLDADGKIIKRMFAERTTNSLANGLPNAVAPTPFTGEFVGELAAVTTTRAGGGLVQFWKMTGAVNSPYGIDYTGARMAGWLGRQDTGCCGNVAWVN